MSKNRADKDDQWKPMIMVSCDQYQYNIDYNNFTGENLQREYFGNSAISFVHVSNTMVYLFILSNKLYFLNGKHTLNTNNILQFYFS